MKELIRGLHEFKETYVSKNRDFFEHLAHGQKPRVLFITCSDSRIVPSLITQTEPGEIFVIRNAGNIIPPFGAANGGEGAAVEYAIHALGIEQIIVCGHSHCGAMKGLLQIGKLEEEMPLVYEWLRHADATRRLVQENYQGYSKDELLEIAIAENVLTQIENLQTYPVVHSRLYQGRLHIYGWVYLIETGEVLAFDPETHQYIPPQTQLDTFGQPGQFVATSAPPVACDLPSFEPVLVPKQVPAMTPIAPGKAASSNGQVAYKSAPGNISWLSPEQADRIYRGSSNGH
ncbi:MAG: carbonic anhydrase [Leptolyngbyaceae cyanobacterium bins.302]|nr:carbonic anhydrase [Leptolyngbyaceae cyanobacterium bins.302]